MLPRVNVSPEAATPLSAPVRAMLQKAASKDFALHASANGAAAG
jgi:hypothetical protein